MRAKKFTKETIREIGVRELDFPQFGVGDIITVSQRIKEGNKERLQLFEGDVIAIKKNGASSTFTIRRIGADSVSVERIFPYYSPKIASIEKIASSQIRRAKLYYMRDRIGKKARLKRDQF